MYCSILKAEHVKATGVEKSRTNFVLFDPL